ncbi:MAG: hypothetical protein LAP13_20870 [Acidobacteriia bacterium]|nr:hypothetical protein [Terriglobia bacterium]
MGLLGAFKKIDRRHWFICHHCLMLSNHDPLKSLFFHDGPGQDFLGRVMYPCPRCSSTNTRSFEQLKTEGSDQALIGLERIVRRHPRSVFEVRPTDKGEKPPDRVVQSSDAAHRE